MIEFILWFLGVLLVAIVTLSFLGKWASGVIQRHIEERVAALDAIVNSGRVPDSWLKSYREKAAKLLARGQDQARLERLGRQAQKYCLRQVDGLIKDLKDGSFTQDPKTREFLLRELQRRRRLWERAEWSSLLVELARQESQETAGEE
ncbi:hypothetical protein FKZ61_003290 [Litorilinea aerophila]|uniref:Uncharacterized protein n=1 Tax=Litorilinea aerophila TaxID=1204385 RepID=A0A540VL07_9CHLR|nr:hypothetical protein [Litorilinea aerophila]MCC9075138.1 hypothetical protein [Litorilinea aerophila]GIV78138.1 MAG: hypothetical protein KatS3mg050_2532 [Litorilinea sp.]